MGGWPFAFTHTPVNEWRNEWRGKQCSTKQVEVYAVREGSDWLVITVIARFF